MCGDEEEEEWEEAEGRGERNDSVNMAAAATVLTGGKKKPEGRSGERSEAEE